MREDLGAFAKIDRILCCKWSEAHFEITAEVAIE